MIIEDTEQTIRLIRKHLSADEAGILIRINESVAKDALASLTAAQLRQIAVKVEDATDRVIITPVDSSLDMLFERFLEELQQE